jgi:hypothetical protein
MVQVVIQPSFGNAAARRHWATTLDVEVPYAQGEYRAALADDEFAALEALHPTGEARFWGATSNHDKRMAALSVGDVILFTGQKVVRAVGEVGFSFRNAIFANTLWAPDPDRGSFHNVYSLLTFQKVQVPYEEIWALPSFNTGDNFMGLRFLDEEKGAEILDGLRIDSVVATQQAAQQELALAATLAAGQPMLPEAVNTTTTSYTKTAGTVVVHRAEALLVQEYIATLNGTSTSRFKTPDGGIADLFVIGPEGAEVIEAKRSADRTLVRHALSQLLDYAPHAPKPADRLTALFPEKPSASSIELLHRYGVDCVYRTAPAAFARLAADSGVRSHVQQRWLS